MAGILVLRRLSVSFEKRIGGRLGDLLGTLAVVHVSCGKCLNRGCAVELGGDRFEGAFRGGI